MSNIDLIFALRPSCLRIFGHARFWFIATVAGTLLIGPGCARKPASAIEATLNKCAQLSQTVNASKMNSAQAATYLATEMQKIDVRGCPEDFRVAFQQHINAWREAAPYLSQNTTLNAVLEGVAAGVLEDPSLIGTAQRNSSLVLGRVNQTYSELVTIAASQGARVPVSQMNK